MCTATAACTAAELGAAQPGRRLPALPAHVRANARWSVHCTRRPAGRQAADGAQAVVLLQAETRAAGRSQQLHTHEVSVWSQTPVWSAAFGGRALPCNATRSPTPSHNTRTHSHHQPTNQPQARLPPRHPAVGRQVWRHPACQVPVAGCAGCDRPCSPSSHHGAR